MPYETLEKPRRQRALRWVLVALVALLVVIGGWFALTKMNEGLQEQAELSVRNAVLDSAKQCCAIEGSYPSSLHYLEENYGLVVNHENYAITYEAFAANVMPSVVVVAR